MPIENLNSGDNEISAEPASEAAATSPSEAADSHCGIESAYQILRDLRHAWF